MSSVLRRNFERIYVSSDHFNGEDTEIILPPYMSDKVLEFLTRFYNHSEATDFWSSEIYRWSIEQRVELYLVSFSIKCPVLLSLSQRAVHEFYAQ